MKRTVRRSNYHRVFDYRGLLDLGYYSRDRRYTLRELFIRFIAGCVITEAVFGETWGAWWAVGPYVVIWVVAVAWLKRRDQV